MQLDYTARQAFKEADPKFLELRDAHRELVKQQHAKDREPFTLVHKMQRWAVVAQLLEGKAYEVDSKVNKKESKLLDKVTGDCGECWESLYLQASEEAMETVYGLCRQISDLRAEYAALEALRHEAWQTFDAYDDVLNARWLEQQPEPLTT
jgi:hypothetical protein